MPQPFELKSARYIAADYLRRFLLPGDIAIDATMGNGHDTQFLCEMVGENGHVYAFDVQPQAVSNTHDRLEACGLRSRATLICDSHEHIDQYVNAPVQAIVFNLGWLPGGDKSITTQWLSTRKAIDSALRLLAPHGICVICVYPGHDEGDREREGLMGMLSALRPQEFNVLHHCFINAGAGAPECFLIQKQNCK